MTCSSLEDVFLRICEGVVDVHDDSNPTPHTSTHIPAVTTSITTHELPPLPPNQLLSHRAIYFSGFANTFALTSKLTTLRCSVVLQCVAVWCSVCVAVCSSNLTMLQCRALHCVAVCCSLFIDIDDVAVWCSLVQYSVVWCSVCVAVCCSVLQCMAVRLL